MAQVQFFDGASSLGVVTASPYSVSVSLFPGSRTLTAVATDNLGATTTSAAVTLTVNSVPIPDPIPAFFTKGDITVEVQTILDGLASPLGMAVPDDGSGRMFVFDQTGYIWVVTSAGKMAVPLLDVRNRLVSFGIYDERGLLGVATHPNFAQNKLVYTYTSEPNNGPADFATSLPSGATNDCQSVIAEWQISASNSNMLDPASRREILRIDKPYSNHNGGGLHFGPDGYLYISLGDGGNANDVGNGHVDGGNAQNLRVILGKLLRIDIDGRNSGNGQYGIPSDNPFINQGGLGEIYAYGFRNPYSYSIDRLTGQIYLGDVGQNKVEEVDIIVKGGNYGWNIKEGTFWFDPSTGNVVTKPVRTVPPGLIDPIADYGHGDGTVVIGGYVYRGNKIPALQGLYTFADWGSFFTPSGKLLFLTTNNAIKELRLGLENRELNNWIKGFGEDADGELYVFATRMLGPSGNTGKMLKIVPAPSPLMIAQIEDEGGTNFATYLAGGIGPFAQQKKSTFNDATWTTVNVTTNIDIDSPLTGNSGFYRLIDTAHQRAIPLSAYLSGAAERPTPVTTTATGFGLFSLEGNSLSFNLNYSGLSAPATAAHIHGRATAAQAAGVVISLIPYAGSPLAAQGTFTGVIVLTDDQKAMILSGLSYVNVHTSNNPGGEIRGQIIPVLMQAGLNGANERPNPIVTDGTGIGTLALVGNQLTFNIGYRNLSGPPTAAHFHGPADASQAAGVIISLVPFNESAFGSNGYISGTVTLSSDQLAEMVDGLTYVNVHTALNPGGEIRGQVVPQVIGVPLSVSLSGAAEQPNPITTSGVGFGLFSLEGDQLKVNLVYSNLSAVATDIQIYAPATSLQSTSAVVDLGPLVIGGFGPRGALAGSVPLTPGQRELILGGMSYLNIKTTANPDGEIRGQLAPVLMVSALSGPNEAPSIATPGFGAGTLVLVGDQLTLDVTYQMLTSIATASHIHGPASLFAPAGVLVSLGALNGGAWGTNGSLAGTVTLNATNLATVIDGRTYINVHTPVNPGGEIRGQINR